VFFCEVRSKGHWLDKKEGSRTGLMVIAHAGIYIVLGEEFGIALQFIVHVCQLRASQLESLEA
jgi:hypothetical protein